MSGIWVKVVCPANRASLPAAEYVAVWEGPLPSVPRVGEYVTVFDGWCGEKVCAVFTALHTENVTKVTVEIGPDFSGEYREEVARRRGGTE